MTGDATPSHEPLRGTGTAPQSEPDTRYPCGAPTLSVIIPHYDDLARAVSGRVESAGVPNALKM